MSKKFIPLAKKVIDLEIQALQKLKKKIDNSFNKAVVEIAKCNSKVILCGVGTVSYTHLTLPTKRIV